MAIPVLNRLLPKRFRSLPSADIGFDNPTFPVDQNGSGKSNVATATRTARPSRDRKCMDGRRR